ncbi:hypothetical protein VKT23_006536 [Stygiomarasmius scandens]|uniref:AAA+ ATPase domain-containing protein n=1 Tax=Marasmiellus scandens TaxID=2682957 RepID=A0ABR1JRD7_9AGAR
MTDPSRVDRLNRVFNNILGRKQALKNHKQFIEAICAQSNAPSCMDQLIARDGLGLVQQAIQSDLGISFLNGPATDLLVFLQNPVIKTIGAGQYLEKTLRVIVDPPIFWDAYVKAMESKELSEPAQLAMAWLLLELLTMPSESASPYIPVAKSLEPIFSTSTFLQLRPFGQKIQKAISVMTTPAASSADIQAGGRHDNDFADFRQIAILPTAEELSSNKTPFLRISSALDDPSTEQNREALYLDNQFRLMREDMLHDLREELQIALGKQKGRKHRHFVVERMRLVGVDFGEEGKRKKWGMIFVCDEDFPQLKNKTEPDQRKKFWKEKESAKILKNQSLTCLLVDGDVVAFPSVRREEELLAKKPPQIVLEMEGRLSVANLLLRLKSAKQTKLIQIDVALFSFEPILNTLKRIKVLPLSEELLFWKAGNVLGSPDHPSPLSSAISTFERNPKQDIRSLLQTEKSIILDPRQAESLLCGLKQNLSIIQGPPGTGKSFIGALLAKFIYQYSDQKIVVVCYTNHALDQFLEDLLDIGIPIENMVRLGGKSTIRTQPMMLSKQPRIGSGRSRADWTIIDGLKADIEARSTSLDTEFQRYLNATVRTEDLLLHLEFDEPDFFEAFEVPQASDGMTIIGENGQPVKTDYLLNRWRNGSDAGLFKEEDNVKAAANIWRMPRKDRQAFLSKCTEEILKLHIEKLQDGTTMYNKVVGELLRKFREGDAAILRTKRIIGCTTTAAAKYGEDIQAASPDVLLVEEAGEILESHIVTALGTTTKQLILIGDHKQLRPKVNNYKLTVEKGDGYDLNVSLFERLVRKGYPHQSLVAQHRMRPEISALVRQLTYPDLTDAPKTQNRPNLTGVRDNIVFFNHKYPEGNMSQIADSRDLGSKSSKENLYEARMAVKIIKYLAQQGYGTEDMVVLTPYLGQLTKLQNEFRKDSETDPVLNDLDSNELVRAGLLIPRQGKPGKKKLRISTIDNYQGEESDIVVCSLTRSNLNHDIGFMFAPERLNVLLSRARNALIMIGNSETFENAKKGKALWKQFFQLLRNRGHVYEGFPVKCERHPDRIGLACNEDQFDTEYPDGGCSEPCGKMLKCNQHTIIPSRCPKGHDTSRKCSQPEVPGCKKCDKEQKDAETRKRKEFERQKKLEEEEAQHWHRMEQIEEERRQQEQMLRDLQLKEEQENALNQKQQDLQDLRSRVDKMRTSAKSKPSTSASGSKTSSSTNTAPRRPSSPSLNAPPSPPTPLSPTPTPKASTSSQSPPSIPSPTQKGPSKTTPSPDRRRAIPTSNPTSTDPSPSELYWQRKKNIEGVTNAAIDAIMEMVGLEQVKEEVIRVCEMIEVMKRQNVPFRKERYNAVFLGNPGTGKTTVARHYSDFLASVDVLPGRAFEEITGSLLAHEGIAGAKKLLEGIRNAGGGSLFIDEAYQLTASHNTGGKTVLDFLLTEMENNVGRFVFIFAGYNKEMESFFEHNPGLNSRVPFRFQFEDYTDKELLRMLEKSVHTKFQGMMKVEDGIQGLYGRIVVKRLGRGRGTKGFGNARALQNLFMRVHMRQTERITKERKLGYRPDDFLLSKEDLIGPEPLQAFLQSPHWKELQEMIGLGSVKQSVQVFFDMIARNYRLELEEKEPMMITLNRVFLGSPGTGKTTVAALYGKILKELGLLSNGEVVIKNPSDFIGSNLGESQKKTKAILANTVGKILIIDEAYMLYGGGKSGEERDFYKKDVIDTIVAEVQSVPGEDRCVLLLGYRDQLIEMFQNVNPGLTRRFKIEEAFNFEDFSMDELRQILELKLKKQSADATPEAKKVALSVLERAKLRPNFGNGGDVENLLGTAKTNFMKRIVATGSNTVDTIYEPHDFDPDFDRVLNAGTNLTELFKDVIGCEDIINQLRRYQEIARFGKENAKDIRNLVPTNFVFKGPPGTGKTTTARKMGQVYFDMGFLSRADVLECSASDLVGQYVGHTGPKVLKLFEKALGQVLFIDEAYRLKEGHFAQEAIDEMVSLLTQDRFIGKIVVILAGYTEDINQLLAVNRGLASRFPEEVLFQNLGPEECIKILEKRLNSDGVSLAGLDDPSSPTHREFFDIFDTLSRFPSWGNARDVVTIAKDLVGLAMVNKNLTLAPADAIKHIENVLTRYYDRELRAPPRRQTRTNLPMQSSAPPSQPPPSGSTSSSTNPSSNTATSQPDPKPKDEAKDKSQPAEKNDGRDPGVSDEVWNQLQLDKIAQAEAQRKLEEETRKAEEQRLEALRKEKEEQQRAKDIALAEARERDFLRREEMKRQREQQRIKLENARRERERLERELRAKREAEEKAKKREQQAQRKLRDFGVCIAGYRWTKQTGGYRCEGGSHFVSDAQLRL